MSIINGIQPGGVTRAAVPATAEKNFSPVQSGEGKVSEDLQNLQSSKTSTLVDIFKTGLALGLEMTVAAYKAIVNISLSIVTGTKAKEESQPLSDKGPNTPTKVQEESRNKWKKGTIDRTMQQIKAQDKSWLENPHNPQAKEDSRGIEQLKLEKMEAFQTNREESLKINKQILSYEKEIAEKQKIIEEEKAQLNDQGALHAGIEDNLRSYTKEIAEFKEEIQKLQEQKNALPKALAETLSRLDNELIELRANEKKG